MKDLLDIPIELQLLICAGKAVKPNSTLTSQGIKHETTVFFCIKGMGGGGNDDHKIILGKLDHYVAIKRRTMLILPSQMNVSHVEKMLPIIVKNVKQCVVRSVMKCGTNINQGEIIP